MIYSPESIVSEIALRKSGDLLKLVRRSSLYYVTQLRFAYFASFFFLPPTRKMLTSSEMM